MHKTLSFQPYFCLMDQIIALIKKDLLVDFRQKYVVAGIALYVFATIYIAYLAFNNVITSATWNALFWLILLFSSITGLGKSFGQEAHRFALLLLPSEACPYFNCKTYLLRFL